MFENKWLNRLVLFVIMTIYTIFIVYICAIPSVTKLRGWVTPANGIMFKNEGYVQISNGQIIDFGNGMKIRIKIERVGK